MTHMNERCKHIGKDGHRCGSYAFNLYKDDIEQGDLCDVHYWQTKAQSAKEPVAWQLKPHPEPEEGDYIEVIARWGKRFVEMPNPIIGGNNLVRFYFDPPQRQPLTDEIPKGVLLAISNAGLTLIKTQHGYELRKLGTIEAAHGITGENNGTR